MLPIHQDLIDRGASSGRFLCLCCLSVEFRAYFWQARMDRGTRVGKRAQARCV